MSLLDLTIAQISEGLKKKEFSALELAQAYLNNIEKADKKIHSFLSVTSDLAVSQAKEIDRLVAAGKTLPLLAGVPCAIKDNILVEGVKCTAASRILENYTAPYDATVVRKLKEKGAIILGKTNLDEFAMGSSTENSAFGPTHNPHDLKRVPGGSSGGSAASVAADLAVFSLGSDTGGSIRLPASFCGVVGLKPTYGRVSRSGLIAFASSLDQIGPIAKNIEDAKIVFEAISGKDSLDSTSVEAPAPKPQKAIHDLKIGIPKEYFVKGIDPEVEKLIKSAIKKYEERGAKIKEVSLPHIEYSLPAYYLISSSEASANLARYDGIKYGQSASQSDLLNVYLKSRGQGFGQEVRRRIMLGTYALSAGYYDAYYLKAQKVRTLVKRDFEKAFQEVDLIMAPVSPSPAFKIGEKTEDPLSMYLVDIYTVSVNLAGLPAISLPVGKVGALPVGLQIIAPAFKKKESLKQENFMEIDFPTIINNIVYYATSPDLQRMLAPVKIVFVLVAFVFIAVLVFTIMKTHYLQWLLLRDVFEFFTHRGYGTSRITKSWQKIQRRLATPLESEYKLAIIESDDILDSSLQKIGYPGQNLEEKLEKITEDTIANIEEVRQAHKVRNNIVHDPDYRLTLDGAKKTLDIYAGAFRDLQILE